METARRYYGGTAVSPVTDAVNLIVQTAFVAEKSIHLLLFLIGSVTNDADTLSKLIEAENRFPFSDLNKVTTSPDAECKDDSETEDDGDDDDDEGAAGGDDSDNDAEDSSSEEDSDNEQGNSDSDSDENDEEEDDDDDDEDDDSDSDEDDDDDDDEDDEEDNQPPF